MKVLIVTTVYDNSIVGAGTFIHALANNLAEVHILSENTEDSKNNTKVKLNLSPIQQKVGAWSRIKPYQKALANIHHDFDIIFFNSPILAHKLPYKVSKKVVFVHDYENTNLSFNGIKSLMLSVWNKYIESTALKSCDIIITNSTFTKRKVLSTYKLTESNIEVCLLGIDLDRFEYTPRTMDLESPKKILFVKEDFKRGGLYILIEALNKLTDYRFMLTLVGFESEHLNLETKEHIKLNPLGRVDNQSIATLLREHDIYCVPSIREALGLGNMEAMSIGTPVVTTDAGGIPEVIDDSCGWIAKANDANSLSQQIKLCIENTEDRLQRSRIARFKVQDFDIKSVVKNLESIFKSVIEK